MKTKTNRTKKQADWNHKWAVRTAQCVLYSRACDFSDLFLIEHRNDMITTAFRFLLNVLAFQNQRILKYINRSLSFAIEQHVYNLFSLMAFHLYFDDSQAVQAPHSQLCFQKEFQCELTHYYVHWIPLLCFALTKHHFHCLHFLRIVSNWIGQFAFKWFSSKINFILIFFSLQTISILTHIDTKCYLTNTQPKEIEKDIN